VSSSDLDALIDGTGADIMDFRIGMKVTTAKGTLRRYGVEC
jgi:hypothetical protein